MTREEILAKIDDLAAQIAALRARVRPRVIIGRPAKTRPHVPVETYVTRAVEALRADGAPVKTGVLRGLIGRPPAGAWVRVRERLIEHPEVVTRGGGARQTMQVADGAADAEPHDCAHTRLRDMRAFLAGKGMVSGGGVQRALGLSKHQWQGVLDVVRDDPEIIVEGEGRARRYGLKTPPSHGRAALEALLRAVLT